MHRRIELALAKSGEKCLVCKIAQKLCLDSAGFCRLSTFPPNTTQLVFAASAHVAIGRSRV